MKNDLLRKLKESHFWPELTAPKQNAIVSAQVLAKNDGVSRQQIVRTYRTRAQNLEERGGNAHDLWRLVLALEGLEADLINIQSLLAGTSVIIVAEADGVVVGIARLDSNGASL